MGTLTRKQFLKGSAIGAAALAATATGPAGLASADEGGHLFIHFQGVLKRGTATIAISVDVAGQKDGLAGAGWDSGMGPNGMVPSTPVGACYYTAAGTLDEHVVKLDGMSLFTNRPAALADAEEAGRSDTRADGRLMKAEANLKTGEIKWTLFPAGTTADFFTGTGVVIKID